MSSRVRDRAMAFGEVDCRRNPTVETLLPFFTKRQFLGRDLKDP
jgi:hypothetical protein